MMNGQRSALLAPIVVSLLRQLGLRPSIPGHYSRGWKSMPVSGIVRRSR